MLENLATLLRRRLSVIADHDLRERDPDAQLEQLKAVSLEISALHERHRKEISPRLNHFLTQCSFNKALELAEQELSAESR